MTNDQREIRRKLRILQHAEESGNVDKTCRYFGIGRASFYRWRQALREHGELGLANARSVPHNHTNKTTPEVVEKVLHLQQNTISGRSASCGTWSDTTTSKSPAPASIESSSATV